MWEQVRAVWQRSSIFIVGLAVIFGSIYLGGQMSSPANPTPAVSSAASSTASPDQGSDRGKAAVAPSGATSPQGGSAKQAGKQLAQSDKTPAPPPAVRDTPAPTPTANAAAPSPAAAPSQPNHDHMAAASPSSPKATTGQSPAPPAPNAPPAAANAAPPAADFLARAGVVRTTQIDGVGCRGVYLASRQMPTNRAAPIGAAMATVSHWGQPKK